MSRFTPGKWERFLYDHGGSRIFCGNELIADTYEPKGNSDLFLAAPYMYEALQEFVAWVEVSQKHGTIKLSTSSQAYIKAKEALAKADGK